MKKLLIALAFVGLSTASFAQEEPTLKNSVATNSFWSNWFIQGGVQWTSFYASEEHGEGLSKSPFKSFRSNPQAAVAIGKWFTPGMGLRVKASGLWGKELGNSFKYWNAQGQALFNISNMIWGYNPNRLWDAIPFAGAGIARNCSTNLYSMGLSVGLLNEFKINKKFAINLELGYNRLENDFTVSGCMTNNGERGWDSHANYLYAEVGVTYNLGKASWDAVPDVDAIKAGYQSSIDALNGKLRDAENEKARLQKLLAEKPKVEKEVVSESIKEFITTPVSVFFNLAKTNVANPKDLVNVRALAKYAVDNNKNILVTGYADSATGTPAINEKLSMNRAETVKGELIKMGVPAEKISTTHNGGVKLLGVDLPLDFDRRATVQIVE